MRREAREEPLRQLMSRREKVQTDTIVSLSQRRKIMQKKIVDVVIDVVVELNDILHVLIDVDANDVRFILTRRRKLQKYMLNDHNVKKAMKTSKLSKQIEIVDIKKKRMKKKKE